MLEVFVLSLIFLLICLTLLGIKVIVKKNGTFPQMHAGGNRGLYKRGIKCAQGQDFDAQKQMNLFERLSK